MQSRAESVAVSYQSAIFPEVTVETLVSFVAGPACSSAKTSTMQVFSGAFIRIQHEGWSNSFPVRLARLIDKTAWTTWLLHTHCFCIALRIICELYTTCIHDYA